MTSQRWDEPTKKAPPTPVPMEERAMSVAQRDRVVTAGSVAAHYAAGHDGPIEECVPCTTPIPSVAGPMFPDQNTRGGSA